MAPGVTVARPPSSSVASDRFSHGPPPPPYSKHRVSHDGHDPTERSGLTAATSMSMSTTRSTRTTSVSRRRSVLVSDRHLADLAAATERAIQWSDILTREPTPARPSTDRAQWQRTDQAGTFAVYSKQEHHKFGVLAVAVLPCSVSEVARVLRSSDAESFLVNMEALYGDEFKDGAFVHRVNTRRLVNDSDDDDDVPVLGDELLDLTVKSAVFHKSGWLTHHERWSFMEATYRRDGGARFEKVTTTLAPKDFAVAKSRMATGSSFPSFARSNSDTARSAKSSKHFHDVTTAFSVQPEEPDDNGTSGSASDASHRPWKEARVFFYGEFTPPARHGFSITSTLARRSLPSSSSDKAIKQRLLTMARSCDRLLALVRRRRLGVQVLVDRRLLAMLTSPSKKCVCCNKPIKLLAIRQCQLCGQCVCSECSHKHERETKVRGGQRMRLEDVRVCDRCLDRVDRSDFSELHDASLLGPTVHANAPHEPPASAVLKHLLKDQLLQADSAERKVSVMNVIKCVLDQDEFNGTAASPAMSTTSSRRGGGGGAVLFASNRSLHDDDVEKALDGLTVPQVRAHEAELSTAHGRSYVVDSSHPEAQMTFPVPENEAARLRAIREGGVQELINNSDELNIICELAAKEMDTFASMVTIVTPDEQQVVASNLDALQNATFPRAEAFCSHTIMDERPILIPHPEADVRFHQCAPVKELGIRYYCGFPIKSEDDTVIGALCCINKASREMSETQFSAMQKLAQTAAKVIQVQGKQQQQARQRTMSAISSASK